MEKMLSSVSERSNYLPASSKENNSDSRNYYWFNALLKAGRIVVDHHLKGGNVNLE